MFKRILVPTDFSSPSDAALELACVLAVRFDASLHLLHIVDDPTASGGFIADGYAPVTEGIRELTLKEARRRLERQLSEKDRERFRVTTDVFIGVPAASIVDYASSTGANLIVMGTHGRSGLAHLLMGSVAEHVVRTASCPVLTVRQATARAESVARTTTLQVPSAEECMSLASCDG